MKRKWLVGIIAYFGLILLCILVIYVIPSVRGMLVSTYLAEQGELSLTDEVEAYVIRDERVYVAGKQASVKHIAEEGKLYKAGTKVVEMTGDGVPSSGQVYTQILASLNGKVKTTEEGYTKYAGYIVYKVDGLERKLKPKKIKKLTHEELEDYSSAVIKKTAKGDCAQGDPIFKVVQNGKYYLISYIDNEDADRYYEGETVTVTVDGQDIRAKVTTVKKDETETKVVLKCGMMYEDYLTDRKVDIVITTAGAKGLKLKDKSIIEKDGKKGVLVKNKIGKYIFKPVCVKADDGKECIVYQDIYMDEKSNFVETISIYDEVIAKPSKKDIENAE